MNINTLQIESIFDSVSSIIKKYDDLALQSGEKFNVFDIIGIKNREVSLHSAMLGNLLNAKGNHGMKGKFLELFIQIIEEKVEINNELDIEFEVNNPFKTIEDCNKTTCKKELHAGERTDLEGGRIDLYISDNLNNAIIIENKIYADEQENQLIRYNNYNNNAPIIFLTLGGHRPSSSINTINGIDISHKIICLSYKKDIIKWLELCMKEVYDRPLILYSIKQYQNLVKIITNQSINKVMENDIKDVILKSEENFSSYYKGFKLYEQIKKDLIESFFTDDNQLNSIIQDLNLKESTHQKRNGENIKFYQNFFTNDFLNEKGIAIGFIFNNGGKKYNNLVFSIRKIEKKSEIEKEKEMVDLFKIQFPDVKYGDNYDWNVIYAEFKGVVMWDDNFGDHGKKIINGEMKALFKEKLEKTLTVIYKTYSIQSNYLNPPYAPHSHL
jgi:hypothetical protein